MHISRMARKGMLDYLDEYGCFRRYTMFGNFPLVYIDEEGAHICADCANDESDRRGLIDAETSCSEGCDCDKCGDEFEFVSEP